MMSAILMVIIIFIFHNPRWEVHPPPRVQCAWIASTLGLANTFVRTVDGLYATIVDRLRICQKRSLEIGNCFRFKIIPEFLTKFH